MRFCRRFLAGIPHFGVDCPRVTHPSATPCLRRAFDLHVLGTPPAFILSQDQTRHPKHLSRLSVTQIATKHGKLRSWHKLQKTWLVRRFIVVSHCETELTETCSILSSTGEVLPGHCSAFHSSVVKVPWKPTGGSSLTSVSCVFARLFQ